MDVSMASLLSFQMSLIKTYNLNNSIVNSDAASGIKTWFRNELAVLCVMYDLFVSELSEADLSNTEHKNAVMRAVTLIEGKLEYLNGFLPLPEWLPCNHATNALLNRK